jgi:alpha-glucosidase (family GH31 glycosyl hydrolase)
MQEKECVELGCCWDDNNMACFHSYPSQHSYSVDDDRNWDNETALSDLKETYLSLKPRRKECLYNKFDAVNLQTRVVSISESILRFYLYDPQTHAPENVTAQINSSEFDIKVYGPEYFSLQIFRNDNVKSPILNTSLGPKIACDNYWELALQLPIDAAVFGLGALRLSSRPTLLYNSGNRLGANPFIMVLDSRGKAYGILFKNSGPMEFQLLAISNILSVKSRSKVMWDISLFAGPSPANVMEQYTSIDGLRPALPPAWALGVHICRDTERYNGTLAAVDFLVNATEMELPYESDCLQERLLYRMNFSIPTDIGDVIEEFNNTGKKLLFSLPPHVSSTKTFTLTYNI